MPEDLKLIRGLQNGCAECLANLFLRYCRLVHSVGWKILREQSEADEIVQEVFIGIFQKAANYDPTRGSVAAWIIQIAYWKAQTRRRQLTLMKLREIESDCLELSEIEAPNPGLNNPERAAIVQQSLSSLNPRQRKIIELIHFEGYTLGESAAIVGESLANARNLYYRGMKALRVHLTSQKACSADCFKAGLGMSRSPSA